MLVVVLLKYEIEANQERRRGVDGVKRTRL
jgi:hypothetical protein